MTLAATDYDLATGRGLDELTQAEQAKLVARRRAAIAHEDGLYREAYSLGRYAEAAQHCLRLARLYTELDYALHGYVFPIMAQLTV